MNLKQRLFIDKTIGVLLYGALAIGATWLLLWFVASAVTGDWDGGRDLPPWLVGLGGAFCGCLVASVFWWGRRFWRLGWVEQEQRDGNE